MITRTENLPVGACLPWPEILDSLPFNTDGLLPTIAQQYDSGEVLMLAWMNRAAILETLSTGRVCYWSRGYGVRARLPAIIKRLKNYASIATAIRYYYWSINRGQPVIPGMPVVFITPCAASKSW